jgi:hypothetical protein
MRDNPPLGETVALRGRNKVIIRAVMDGETIKRVSGRHGLSSKYVSNFIMWRFFWRNYPAVMERVDTYQGGTQGRLRRLRAEVAAWKAQGFDYLYDGDPEQEEEHSPSRSGDRCPHCWRVAHATKRTALITT